MTRHGHWSGIVGDHGYHRDEGSVYHLKSSGMESSYANVPSTFFPNSMKPHLRCCTEVS